MSIEVGKKALITTDGWFLAPEGKYISSARKPLIYYSEG